MTCAKVMEVVGSSKKDWSDAVENAVAEALRSVPRVHAVEVVNMTANVEGGKIQEFKADCKVAYLE